MIHDLLRTYGFAIAMAAYAFGPGRVKPELGLNFILAIYKPFLRLYVAIGVCFFLLMFCSRAFTNPAGTTTPTLLLNSTSCRPSSSSGPVIFEIE